MSRLKTLKPRLAELKADRVKTITPGSWRSGKTTAQRGYGGRWQRARIRHLQNNPLCVMCEADGRVAAATVVDHKVPHRGDEALFWDTDNWQSLCASHHASEKQRQENSQWPG
jgi:5-methylcytosine-specific restriction endonuclease McrA